MPASLQAMPFHQYFFFAPGGSVVHVCPPVPEALLKKPTEVRSMDPPLGVQYLLGQEAGDLTEGALNDQNGNGQLDRSESAGRHPRTTVRQPTLGMTARPADADQCWWPTDARCDAPRPFFS